MIKLKHAALAAIQILMLQAGVALAAEEPLPPDQAFKLKVSLRGSNTVIAEFTPAKGHYLYKNKTFFALKNSSSVLIREVRLPPGDVKKDPFLGTMETYKKLSRSRSSWTVRRKQNALHCSRITRDATKRSGFVIRRNRSLSTWHFHSIRFRLCLIVNFYLNYMHTCVIMHICI